MVLGTALDARDTSGGRNAYRGTQTLTTIVNAGASTGWVDARALESLVFLVESTLTQACDVYVQGAHAADGTGAQNLGGGQKLALGVGSSTATKGILEVGRFAGWLRIFVDPAADATGSAVIRLNAGRREA